MAATATAITLPPTYPCTLAQAEPLAILLSSAVQPGSSNRGRDDISSFLLLSSSSSSLYAPSSFFYPHPTPPPTRSNERVAGRNLFLLCASHHEQSLTTASNTARARERGVLGCTVVERRVSPSSSLPLHSPRLPSPSNLSSFLSDSLFLSGSLSTRDICSFHSGSVVPSPTHGRARSQR